MRFLSRNAPTGNKDGEVNGKMSKKKSTLKALYTYIIFGGIYLLGAVIWFVISYFRNELDSPVTLFS